LGRRFKPISGQQAFSSGPVHLPVTVLTEDEMIMKETGKYKCVLEGCCRKYFA